MTLDRWGIDSSARLRISPEIDERLSDAGFADRQGHRLDAEHFWPELHWNGANMVDSVGLPLAELAVE